MGFKTFYLTESESDLVIKKDDFHWFNVDAAPQTKLKEIVKKAQKIGFDIRDSDDLKTLLKKRPHIIGEQETKFYKLINSELTKIIVSVLGKKKPEPKTDLLSLVLKKIRYDRESGMKLGTIVSKTTGYILPDGRVLDLGGTHSRANDHRVINHYFESEFSSQTSKMKHFLEQTGVIRYIPEGIGFDIAKEPTRKQLVQIQNAIMKNPNNEISLDLTSDNFKRFGKVYKEGTRPVIVLRDIQTYYRDGTVRNTEHFER